MSARAVVILGQQICRNSFWTLNDTSWESSRDCRTASSKPIAAWSTWISTRQWSLRTPRDWCFTTQRMEPRATPRWTSLFFRRCTSRTTPMPVSGASCSLCVRVIRRGVAGESGKVHSTVRQRWLNHDPDVLRCMEELGALAHCGTQALMTRDFATLAKLMDRNFDIRRYLYGDKTVGESNLAAIMLARSHGLSAKFTGSGGCIVCMTPNGQWLNPTEEKELERAFASIHFCLQRALYEDTSSLY